MIIGSVPNPREWPLWPQAEAYLEPARAQGDFDTVIEPDEALWVVIDENGLLGCATAWLQDERCEVKLVGGREHRRWIAELDQVIGAAAAEAGATHIVAMGRAGWRRTLPALGWAVIGEVDGSTVYRREL